MKRIPINEAFQETSRYSPEAMSVIEELDRTYETLFSLFEKLESICPENVPHIPDDIQESMIKAINSTRYARDRCGNFFRKYN